MPLESILGTVTKNWLLLQKPPCFFSHIFFVPIVFPNVVSLFCHLLACCTGGKAQLFFYPTSIIWNLCLFVYHVLFDKCPFD